MARPDDIAAEIWKTATGIAALLWLDINRAQTGAELIARAILADREVQRERYVQIAEERFRRSLAEIPTEGDDYWQGSGAAAQVIANKIRGAR